MESNQRKKREFIRREIEILEATERLLKTTDDNVTVDRIAAEVGIGKGTIYKHFKTKHEIVARLVELVLLARWDILAASERTPMDRLQGYLKFRLGQPEQERYLRLWHQSLVDYQQRESIELLAKRTEQERFRLAELLDQAGCTSESRSPLTMAGLLLAMVQGILIEGASQLHPYMPESINGGVGQWLLDSVNRHSTRRVTVL